MSELSPFSFGMVPVFWPLGATIASEEQWEMCHTEIREILQLDFKPWNFYINMLSFQPVPDELWSVHFGLINSVFQKTLLIAIFDLISFFNLVPKVSCHGYSQWPCEVHIQFCQIFRLTTTGLQNSLHYFHSEKLCNLMCDTALRLTSVRIWL